jgi:hypothetical protein
MRRLSGTGIGLIVALAFTGCSTPKSATSADLTGKWLLAMPNGQQLYVRIISEGGQRYRIWKGGTVINGSYERRGNRLVMLTPADARMKEFVWKIDDANHLTLIKEPPVAKTGQRYRKATLKREGLKLPAVPSVE